MILRLISSITGHQLQDAESDAAVCKTIKTEQVSETSLTKSESSSISNTESDFKTESNYNLGSDFHTESDDNHGSDFHSESDYNHVSDEFINMEMEQIDSGVGNDVEPTVQKVVDPSEHIFLGENEPNKYGESMNSDIKQASSCEPSQFDATPTETTKSSAGLVTASAIENLQTQFGVKSFQVNMVPAGILAYMGDAVYELIVRNFLIQRGYWDSHKIHRQSIKFVNAGAQAELLRYLEPQLTDDERIVLRRARNSNAGNVPRHAKVSDYRYSTAFEAVLGYLVIKGDLARFAELQIMIEEYLMEKISGK